MPRIVIKVFVLGLFVLFYFLNKLSPNRIAKTVVLTALISKVTSPKATGSLATHGTKLLSSWSFEMVQRMFCEASFMSAVTSSKAQMLSFYCQTIVWMF